MDESWGKMLDQKPNNVKSLQSWGSWIRRASGQRLITQIAKNILLLIMLEDGDKILKTMWIEEELPIDDVIQPIKTSVEYESATDFKGFEALHNIVLNINDQLLCSDV